MSVSNRFKNKSKSPENKKTGFFKRVQRVFSLWRDERFQKFSGLSLLLLSFYLLVAFTSFLFTWKSDQDILYQPLSEFLLNPEVLADNWLGKLGAIVSHQFIHNGFGISSFLFVFIFGLLGIRILFKINFFSVKSVLRISFFALIWISVALGYFYDAPHHYLGGAFGFHINNWLSSILGNIGSGCFIAFCLLTFLIFSFNISFGWIKSAFVVFAQSEIKPVEAEADEIDQEAADDNMNDSLGDNTGHTVQENLPEDSETEGTENTAVDLDPVSAGDGEKESGTAKKTGSPADPEFDIEEAQSDDVTLSDKEIDKKAKDFGEYDPTLDLGKYRFPVLDLLNEYGSGTITVEREELETNKNRIVDTLGNYNIGIAKIKANIGPTVTLYEIIPEAGVRISKIKNLEDDIALSLAALGIRIIAPIPGRGTIGIEVPNQNAEMVSMRTLIASDKFQNTDMDLPIALGKTISNETFITDLAKMPHLLMAGATGQGKSVGLNTILVSLLYKKHPSQVKFVLVDPKKVELTLFNKIERHFLAKLPGEEEAIITDTKKVVNTLNSLCIEMDNRYELLKTAMVRNIKEYNAKFIARKLNPNNGHQFLPYIVLVVDEFADLIMTAGKEVETPIARLAQLARAIGIHLIIATQRPSVNIITGTIKANFPSRIAFRVTSKVDSRTILDAGGADQLIGKGDMLLSTGNDLIRLQCAFVDTPEVDKITEFIGNQQGYPDAMLLPEYVGESESGNAGDMSAEDRDALFEDAARIVVQHQQGSASLLQRRLKLGYNRAGRIIDQLEFAGIIGPFEGSKARQVLIPDEHSLEQFLKGNQNDGNPSTE